MPPAEYRLSPASHVVSVASLQPFLYAPARVIFLKCDFSYVSPCRNTQSSLNNQQTGHKCLQLKVGIIWQLALAFAVRTLDFHWFILLFISITSLA